MSEYSNRFEADNATRYEYSQLAYAVIKGGEYGALNRCFVCDRPVAALTA
jgi:hypothetical protein